MHDYPLLHRHLDFSTAATDRSLDIAQLDREQPVVTAMPGCVAFRVFADRLNDTGITVPHEWIDRASLTSTSPRAPSGGQVRS